MSTKTFGKYTITVPAARKDTARLELSKIADITAEEDDGRDVMFLVKVTVAGWHKQSIIEHCLHGLNDPQVRVHTLESPSGTKAFVLKLLYRLSDADRREVFSGFGQFCEHCGSGKLPCYCYRNA